MLNLAQRGVLAPVLAFKHRTVIGHVCGYLHMHATTICFRHPLRSSFFSLPSLNKLPFGQIPQLVTFSDIRVVPYPCTVVVETVCDVNRYKVAPQAILIDSRSFSPSSRNFFLGSKTRVFYRRSPPGSPRPQLAVALLRSQAAAAVASRSTAARDCVNCAWVSAPSQKGT
jgi:hypothetical protein